MTFGEQLVVTVVDKLFIAVIVAAFGYWLKRRLEAAKREEQFRLQVALSRLSAYKALSALLEVTSPSGKDELRTEDRAHLGALLRGWYYDQGNHLFLPAVTTDLFLKAKGLLEDKGTAQEIRNAFSSLRTQLKLDLGVYDAEEAKRPLGPR